MKINKKAFTLIELMIVLAIIAILAILLLPKAQYYVEQSKRTGIEQNRRTLVALATNKYEKNYDNSTDDTDRVQKTYDDLSKIDDINKLRNPLNKVQVGLGIITGSTFTDQGKAAYVLTEIPNEGDIPDGVVFVVLKDGKTTSTIPEKKVFDYDIVDSDKKLRFDDSCELTVLINSNEAWLFGASSESGQEYYTSAPGIVDDFSIRDIEHTYGGTFVVTTDGDLYFRNGSTFGTKYYFGNNLGTFKTFTKLLSNVRDVECSGIGGRATYLIMEDGSVMAAGLDNYNESFGIPTGNTDMEYYPIFTEIPNISNARYIEAAQNNTFIVTSDGSVYACGNNSNYVLGIQSAVDQSTVSGFVKLDSISNVKKVKNGFYATMFLTEDGDVYVCGYVKAVYGSSVYDLKVTGDMYASKSTSKSIQKVPGLPKIKDIESGYDMYYLLDYDGNLYIAGRPQPGCSGVGDVGWIDGYMLIREKVVSEIAAGYASVAYIASYSNGDYLEYAGVNYHHTHIVFPWESPYDTSNKPYFTGYAPPYDKVKNR